ncbi:Uncharacterized protein FKW44_016390 [Caligus rogercresseyi]|uniref:Histone-lysine N-methyltransferase SETMAR n=1 Tax=Caligus rogercresseyi TaxID=217165 RepID=A0A7T8K1B4_CALRO|nr:Uncharacterized protein FKW44_016390 [Caligus rogercresseyi]
METPNFRSYFLIRIKLARTVNEIHGDLLSTFPDSCPGLSTLQRWHTEFDKGVFAQEKKARPGRPRRRGQRRMMTTRQVAAEVSLPSKTVFRLLTEDLGLQTSSAQQDAASEVLSEPPEAVPGPRGGLSGVSSVSPGQVLVLLGFGGAEAILDPPCETDSEEDDDSDGVHLQAEVANRNTMIEYLRTTGKRFLSLKKDKIRLNDCLLIWDNVRPHTATDTKESSLRDVEPVKQSPYSPDLNLCDRSLFRQLKHLLWEDEFGGHEETTLAVQRAMRRVSEDELYDQLRKPGTLPRRHCSRRGLCVLIDKFFC